MPVIHKKYIVWLFYVLQGVRYQTKLIFEHVVSMHLIVGKFPSITDMQFFSSLLWVKLCRDKNNCVVFQGNLSTKLYVYNQK